jgi:hypothetical protein
VVLFKQKFFSWTKLNTLKNMKLLVKFLQDRQKKEDWKDHNNNIWYDKACIFEKWRRYYVKEAVTKYRLLIILEKANNFDSC